MVAWRGDSVAIQRWHVHDRWTVDSISAVPVAEICALFRVPTPGQILPSLLATISGICGREYHPISSRKKPAAVAAAIEWKSEWADKQAGTGGRADGRTGGQH